jgi:hypothetical protein
MPFCPAVVGLRTLRYTCDLCCRPGSGTNSVTGGAVGSIHHDFRGHHASHCSHPDRGTSPTVGAGDWCREIALLKVIHRTCTVTTLNEAALMVMSRRSFVRSAFTGTPHSTHAAGAYEKRCRDLNGD